MVSESEGVVSGVCVLIDIHAGVRFGDRFCNGIHGLPTVWRVGRVKRQDGGRFGAGES